MYVNGLPNEKKTQCSTFKIVTRETLQSWKIYIFFSTAIIPQLQRGAIHDKQPPLTTSVWLLIA